MFPLLNEILCSSLQLKNQKKKCFDLFDLFSSMKKHLCLVEKINLRFYQETVSRLLTCLNL